MMIGCSTLVFEFMASADTIIGAITGAILGFAAAIFVEPIKSRLYGPRLKVFFDDSSECQTKTHERLTNNRETSYHEASYIRIRVTNTKTALAKGCRAYLVKRGKCPEKCKSRGRYNC